MRVDIIAVYDVSGLDPKLRVFVAGVEVDEPYVYAIDAVEGYDWADWVTKRDSDLTADAPDSVHDALVEAYTDPPGGADIGERNGRDWIYGVTDR